MTFSRASGKASFKATPMKTGLNIGNQAPATFTMTGDLVSTPF